MKNKKNSFCKYLVILFCNVLKILESYSTPEIGSNLAEKNQSRRQRNLPLLYSNSKRE